ncbi:NAD-dependent epimerase/dehydratase family protein [Rubrivirga sp.]|uniref:NAD-dependent epimerase/dehydratase family protein n=1 Tax=Rubrivirga sp. TaxID=1885344 RepID=UPI003B51FED2
MPSLPATIPDEAALDDWMSRPSDALTSFVATLRGPLVVLGAGGKMGPSLCALARRAADAAGHDLEVVAVSRFSDPDVRRWLDARGVRTQACDLMTDDLGALPDAENVLYLVGLKFGTQQAPAQTWAVNTLVPARVTERYAGARVVALSSGNVYPFVPVASGGSLEDDPLTPLGEYPNACVARERLFQYGSQTHGTPGVLVRLNYATDLRYGVLVDLAQQIAAGRPIDVTMGYLNCIWQRDANDAVVRALEVAETPMRPLNLTGIERLSVRRLAEALAERMGRDLEVVGQEAPTALLSNVSRMVETLGAPETPLDTVLDWTAAWVAGGGPTLGKPTRFEVRDGHY